MKPWHSEDTHGQEADDDAADDGQDAVEEDAEAEGEGPNPDDVEHRSSRKIFNILRASHKNTAQFAADLFGERKLQKQSRIITDGLAALHSEHSRDLQAHALGQHETLYWHARRCNGSWWQTICETLSLLQGPDMSVRLDLQPKGTLEALQDAADPAVIEEDRALTRQLFDFLVDLSSNRAWSQAFHMYLFPWALGAIFQKDATPDDLRKIQARLKKLADSQPAGV